MLHGGEVCTPARSKGLSEENSVREFLFGNPPEVQGFATQPFSALIVEPNKTCPTATNGAHLPEFREFALTLP